MITLPTHALAAAIGTVKGPGPRDLTAVAPPPAGRAGAVLAGSRCPQAVTVTSQRPGQCDAGGRTKAATRSRSQTRSANRGNFNLTRLSQADSESASRCFGRPRCSWQRARWDGDCEGPVVAFTAPQAPPQERPCAIIVMRVYGDLPPVVLSSLPVMPTDEDRAAP